PGGADRPGAAGRPRPAAAQGAHLCAAAARDPARQSTAAPGARHRGSALERPDLGRMAGSAGRAARGPARAPPDDVPPRVSAALAAALGGDSNGLAAAVAG